MHLTTLLTSSLLTTVAYSATITGHINLPYNITYKDVQNTNIEIQQVGLKSNPNKSLISRKTFLQSNSIFKFNDIKDGDYLLSVESFDFNLTPSKVKISIRDDELKAFIYEVGSSFEDSNVQVNHPVQFRTVQGKERRIYSVPPSNGIFDVEPIKTIVNSPLYLSLLVGLIALYVIPLIWEMVDPEVAAISKRQRNGVKPGIREKKDEGETMIEESAAEKQSSIEEKPELIEEKPAENNSNMKNKKRKN